MPKERRAHLGLESIYLLLVQLFPGGNVLALRHLAVLRNLTGCMQRGLLLPTARSMRALPRPDLCRPAVEVVAKVFADERNALPNSPRGLAKESGDDDCTCDKGGSGRAEPQRVLLPPSFMPRDHHLVHANSGLAQAPFPFWRCAHFG